MSGLEHSVLFSLLPVLFLVGTGILVLVFGLFGRDKAGEGWRTAFLVSGCVASLVAALSHFGCSGTGLGGSVFVDSFSAVLALIILLGALLTLLMQQGTLSREGVKFESDAQILLLFAAAGGLVMVSAANLLLLFLGIELLSLCVYVLAGSARDEKASAEGALKYFILGSFSSAFLLYGMALVYAAAGSLGFSGIAIAANSASALFVVGLALILFGFAFKASLVPFHLWTPDAYQGSPVSIAGFMAVSVKAAALGAFLRLLHAGFGGLSPLWTSTLWVLVVLTMTVGNLAALHQRSLKRMLAYSSIAHAGYALMGLLVFRSPAGAQALLFYLFAYLLMTISAFASVLAATIGTKSQYERDDLRFCAGLGRRRPLLGLAMALSFLSLAGVPPLVGFAGKLMLFLAALEGGYAVLVVLAALNSVVALYYYLRVLVVIYFEEPLSESFEIGEAFCPGAAVVLSLGCLAIIGLGVGAEPLISFVRTAVSSLI